jgi:hypothetical protein
MVTNGPGEDEIIENCAFLAANSKMPSGERMIDRLIVYANTVRVARKARWPASCVTPLEEDLILVLADFCRRAAWYRDPVDGEFPA